MAQLRRPSFSYICGATHLCQLAPLRLAGRLRRWGREPSLEQGHWRSIAGVSTIGLQVGILQPRRYVFWGWVGAPGMNDIWHYADQGKSVGPVSLDELVRALSKQKIPGAVLIWKPGFPSWQAAISVPEVAVLIATPPDIPGLDGNAPTPSYSPPPQQPVKPARIVRTEKRKRGFFGWVFLLLFLSFNALMVVWLFSYWNTVLPMTGTGSEAGRAGAAIGTAMGTGVIISIWTCGSVVLGLFVLFTRGRKVIVEEERRD